MNLLKEGQTTWFRFMFSTSATGKLHRLDPNQYPLFDLDPLLQISQILTKNLPNTLNWLTTVINLHPVLSDSFFLKRASGSNSVKCMVIGSSPAIILGFLDARNLGNNTTLVTG